MTSRAQRSSFFGPGDDRGNALVLAILIVLALTSVGVVSVQRTNMDLLVAGNISRAARAWMAGEAGLLYGMGMVGANPNPFLDKIEIQKTGGNLGAGGDVEASDELTVLVGQKSTVLPDAQAQDRLPHVAHDDAARSRQDAAFDVRAVFVNEVKSVAGSSTDVDVCFELFDFNARGGIPTAFGETVEETLSQRHTVVVRSRARVMVGEVKCRLAH